MAQDNRAETKEWPTRPHAKRQARGGRGSGKVATAAAAAVIGVGALAARGGYATYSDVREEVGDFHEKVQNFLGKEEITEQETTRQALVDNRIRALGIINDELTPQQAEDVSIKILNAERTIANNINIEVIKRVRGYEPLITKASGNTGVPKNLLIGLILTESLGDRYAISSAGAAGLTQITDEMAKELDIKTSVGIIARDQNYDAAKDEIDERYKPEVVIEKTAQKLKEWHDSRAEDWEIDAWMWHAGSGNAYKAFQAYILDVDGQQFPPVVLNDPMAANVVAVYKKEIAERKINFHRLFENDTVRNMFSGEGWDKTDEYLYRIIAAAMIYQNYAPILEQAQAAG